MTGPLHIICERDVGLFSLVQQVIANVPWALREGRAPVAFFGNRTCYWTPNGYGGADTVWEYYFEPLILETPVSAIPDAVKTEIVNNPPGPYDTGYALSSDIFVSAHFGDHPDLQGKTLSIPYLLEDPSLGIRLRASAIISEFVRPKRSLLDRVSEFSKTQLDGRYVIGVHVRGTDAASTKEIRAHRQNSLQLENYFLAVGSLLKAHPEAQVFLATDTEAVVAQFKERYGPLVKSCDTVRHVSGAAAGEGPTGWIMPNYISADRDTAAKNGEDAITDYLLLSQCDYLVHNGSSLARTALLAKPDLKFINVHGQLFKRKHARAILQQEQCDTTEILEDDYPKSGVASPSSLRILSRISWFQSSRWLKRLAPVRSEQNGLGATELQDSLEAAPVDKNTIEKVIARKEARRLAPIQYRDWSSIAFVVHSFNRKSNLVHLIEGLRRLGHHEIVVCDDGSIDGSREQWLETLEQPNDFLICSNDLHEIRMLDRAINFARADIVCIVQDDDRIPEDDKWLGDALLRFEEIPALAVIGGFMGFESFEPDPITSRDSSVWGDVDFQFVTHVNIGPYFIRKDAYSSLGGFDHSLSSVGEPGIGFDSEFCLRAWINDWKVAYSFIPFKGPGKSYTLDGGTMLFGKDMRFRNQWLNHQRLAEKYQTCLQTIYAAANAANRELLQRDDLAQRVLAKIEQGFSPQTVGAHFNVKIATVNRWIRRFNAMKRWEAERLETLEAKIQHMSERLVAWEATREHGEDT